MVGDHSRQMKTQICTVGDVGDGFRFLPISITNKHGVSLAQEGRKNDMVFLVGFCLSRIEILALTIERKNADVLRTTQHKLVCIHVAV